MGILCLLTNTKVYRRNRRTHSLLILIYNHLVLFFVNHMICFSPFQRIRHHTQRFLEFCKGMRKHGHLSMIEDIHCTRLLHPRLAIDLKRTLSFHINMYMLPSANKKRLRQPSLFNKTSESYTRCCNMQNIPEADHLKHPIRTAEVVIVLTQRKTASCIVWNIQTNHTHSIFYTK